jgi:hypothetical protein
VRTASGDELQLFGYYQGVPMYGSTVPLR